MLDQISRKHGILKKSGGSLDESHLRRSCSPDMESTGSILKNGRNRRSSLEENGNRQSILKKKDDEHGPYGILKKKNSIDEGFEHMYMSIADHTILAANGDKTLQNVEEVKPILKKRRSTEEHPFLDPASSSETTPRPILKKKSSTDTDELDDWPKKTILKTSHRKSKNENTDISEVLRRISLESAPLTKPTAQRLSFCDDEDQSSESENELGPRVRASKSFSSVRSTSPSGSHSDFSSLAWTIREHNSGLGPRENRVDSPHPLLDQVTDVEGTFHINGTSSQPVPVPSFSSHK